MAQLAYTHGGQSWSSVGVYHSNVRKLATTNEKPSVVIYPRCQYIVLRRVSVAHVVDRGTRVDSVSLTRFGLQVC